MTDEISPRSPRARLERTHSIAIVDQIYDKYCEEILVDTYEYDTPPLKWYFSRYATLIHVADVIAYGNPFPYKQKGRSAWLVLDAPLM